MAGAHVDPERGCCPMMARQVQRKCDVHTSPWDCPDFVIVRGADGTYGLPVRDGEFCSASSSIPIWHCPWCGNRLPGHQTHPRPDDTLPHGKALTDDEVEARSEAWHNGAGVTVEFHDYLGWTWEEYGTWLETGALPAE